MSIFTSRIPPKTLPVPAEPSHTITFRKLAPRQLEKAAKVAQRAAMRESVENMQDMGGVDAMKAMSEAFEAFKAKDEKKDAATPAEKPDPIAGFDRVTLMTEAVVGWTFEEERTAETFADLDDETQHWLATEIVRFAKPSLFQTATEAEDARFSG